jgi:hypothetical protein
MKKVCLIGFFIFAACLAGGTSVSAAIKVTAPTNLVASPISNTEINLSWKDNSSNESGFAIESSLDKNVYHEVARTAANAVSFSDINLTPGTKYYYRVRAFAIVSGQTTYSKYCIR